MVSGARGWFAVADILMGKVNPSAKLTTTFPRSNSQNPIWYGDGYDPSDMPLYPFGHGLSYTKYEYSDLKISDLTPSTSSDLIDVSFRVKNIGGVDGSEIAQLYVAPKDSPLAERYPQRLQGFARIDLKANESKRVTLRLSPQQFAHLDKQMKFAIEPGRYEIEVGASSLDIRLREEIQFVDSRKVLESGRSVFFSETVIEK